MSDPKDDTARPYAPDFVSAETLAYRLDCSRSTVDTYVRGGLLPKPEMIGNLPRWDFAEVRAFIRARNRGMVPAIAAGGINANGRPNDIYLERLKGGTAS